MKFILLVGLACAFAPEVKAQILPGRVCEHPVTRNVAENRSFLAHRAAEILGRVRGPGWRTDPVLHELVSAKADSRVVSGDTGQILEEGLAGIRALASRITGLTYRYKLPAGFADGPFDPCADQYIDLEFDDGATHTRMEVQFVFHEDVLRSVTGQESGFGEGTLKPAD